MRESFVVLLGGVCQDDGSRRLNAMVVFHGWIAGGNAVDFPAGHDFFTHTNHLLDSDVDFMNDNVSIDILRILDESLSHASWPILNGRNVTLVLSHE